MFCSDCSIKEKHLGFFVPKRFCKDCYSEYLLGHKRQNPKTKKNKSDPLENIKAEGIQNIESIASAAGIPEKEIRDNKDSIVGVFSFMLDGIKSLPSDSGFQEAMMQRVQLIQENPEDKYRVVRKIGEGASGSVYLAEHKLTLEAFALKKIHPKNERKRNQIINEIALTMLSDNPNIITYYESYEYSGCLWLIVELMKGSLTDLIVDKPGQIPEHLIAYLFREILKGLLCLHGHHRIHRDVKSDNVLINLQGEVKLGDFGYAAQLTTEKDKRKTIVGTPSWMAPELILGQDYDEEVDLWSLGIVGLELAEGEPPYMRENPMKALYLISNRPPPELKNKARWSPEFCSFVQSCLVKEPERRPSALQLLGDPFILSTPPRAKSLFAKFVQDWLESKSR